MKPVSNPFEDLDEYAIAADFAKRVCDYVGPENYAAIRELNASGTLPPYCCASHDYCDANVFLFEALSDAVSGLSEAGETDGLMDCMSTAWNRIHEIATRHYFTE